MSHLESDYERQARQLLRLDELEAENQRLREALDEIAAFESRSPDMLSARVIAREALAGDGE
jgi:cell shape-determining protein MreC